MSAYSRLLVSLLVLSLLLGTVAMSVGCGGDEEETTTTVSTVPPTDSGGGVEEEEISLEGTEFEPTDGTPDEVAEAVEDNDALLVMLYVPGGSDDRVVRDSVDDLSRRYSGVVFATYDYRDPEAYGDLARLLEIEYTPAIVLIDENGIISRVFTGYVDEGSLNQALTNIR